MRDVNRVIVLDLLQRLGAQTRAELAIHSSLTPQALGSILAELVDEGLVLALEPEISGRGRPSASYQLDPDGAFWLGISIQWRSVLLAVLDSHGQIRKRAQISHDGSSAQEILNDAAQMASVLVNTVDAVGDRLFAVGLSVQGLVEAHHGIVAESVAWPERNVDVRSEFMALTGWPTRIDSAAHATARAEALRSAHRDGTVAVLYFSHDPYLVQVHNGTVLRGHNGLGGALAHMPISGATERCSCGRQGCLRTVVSGTALVERYSSESGQTVHAVPDVIDAARLGDELAKNALYDFSVAVSQMTATLMPYIDPSQLIISGLVGGVDSRGAKNLAEHIERELATSGSSPEIVISPLGRDAHTWGALALAHEERSLK